MQGAHISKIALAVVFSFLLLIGNKSRAQNLLREPRLLADNTASNPERLKFPSGGTLLAQANDDDAYDPFADYSDFEQTEEEEEDENFFRNGRLITIGFVGGYRGFTGTLGSIYTPNASFGLYLCYFFDLRFALQIGYLSGDYALNVQGPSELVTGNISLSDVSFNLKYYFNTQNVTRGLADLNPYAIFGLSEIFRTVSLSTNNSTIGKDSALAGNIGLGIEIPIMRNKMYLGAQGMFQYLSFPDAGQSILQSNNVSTGVKLSGNSYMVTAILGVNF